MRKSKKFALNTTSYESEPKKYSGYGFHDDPIPDSAIHIIFYDQW